MPDFRRGAQAIIEARERAKSGGSFHRFTPSVFWQDDGDEKYLLFLNAMDDIPQVDMIGYIPQVGKKNDDTTFEYFEQTIARTDQGIGEDSDPIVKEWNFKPRETNVAVAVELEPLFETVKGRKRPRGFEVATRTFDKRVKDDAGNLTDESEEVTAPVVGFVSQSPHNFFNVVQSFDAKEAPINETAVKITRVGAKGDNSVTYRIDGYPEQDIDLTNLIDYVDGLSYLDDDEIDELVEALEDVEDAEAVEIIGAVLLDKRLEELADPERHEKLYKSITKPAKFGNTKDKKDRKPSKARTSRRSQRKASVEEPEEPEAEVTEDAPEEPKAKPKRSSRARKPKAEAEDTGDTTPEPKAQNPKAVTKLDELRSRAAKRKATATA